MVLYSGIQFGHSEKAWRLGLLMTSLESLYELKIQAVCFGNPMVLCLPVKGDPDTLENQGSDCCELVSLTHIHIEWASALVPPTPYLGGPVERGRERERGRKKERKIDR